MATIHFSQSTFDQHFHELIDLFKDCNVSEMFSPGLNIYQYRIDNNSLTYRFDIKDKKRGIFIYNAEKFSNIYICDNNITIQRAIGFTDLEPSHSLINDNLVSIIQNEAQFVA